MLTVVATNVVRGFTGGRRVGAELGQKGLIELDVRCDGALDFRKRYSRLEGGKFRPLAFEHEMPDIQNSKERIGVYCVQTIPDQEWTARWHNDKY